MAAKKPASKIGGKRPQGRARPTGGRPTTDAGRDAANKARMARKAENRLRNREAWEAELERRAAIRVAREARLGPKEPRRGSTLDIARELARTAPEAIAVQALRVLVPLESERETIARQAARIAELELALARVDPNTLTPEQRVVLSLADAVHGPLIREAVDRERDSMLDRAYRSQDDALDKGSLEAQLHEFLETSARALGSEDP